jgi:hypothetical protein
MAIGDFLVAAREAYVLSPDRHDEIWALQKTLKYGATVYGACPASTMREIMAGQSDFYGAHRSDWGVE